MLRLSFIVPFYNVELYIEECIRSLYNQDITQDEYEVICVDDASPDRSIEIIEQYRKKMCDVSKSDVCNLKIIRHTENKRQGGARNTGLREAKGKYVWFVDGDDYIQPNCVGAMLKLAEEHNLDLLKFHFGYSNAKSSSHYVCSKTVTSGSDLIFDTQKEIPMLERCNSAVQQLILRELLIDHAISFAEGLQYEDDDYAYQLYAYAERAYLMDSAPYIVRMSPDSTTRRNNDLRRVRDIYAQAIRMARLDAKLTKYDERWHEMIKECINDCINNCVFRMLNGLSVSQQLHFWYGDRKQLWILKPYLSRKAYVKLSSYIMWRLLQK